MFAAANGAVEDSGKPVPPGERLTHLTDRHPDGNRLRYRGGHNAHRGFVCERVVPSVVHGLGGAPMSLVKVVGWQCGCHE